MLFTTASARDAFFARGYADPGDAMYHARSVNLGIWGNEESLRRDCAQVLAMEIRSETGEKVDVEEVLHVSDAFRRAFDAARGRDDAIRSSMLSGLGRAVGNAALHETAEHELDEAVSRFRGIHASPETLARVVFEELMRKRRPDARSPFHDDEYEEDVRF